jgi:hypothetical protein
VYRVVGGVFVIAVTRAGANPFAALNLVVSVTRLVCAECKAVDLTAARIQKRYAQARAGCGGRGGCGGPAHARTHARTQCSRTHANAHAS